MADQAELAEAARLVTAWAERARLAEIALRYFRYWAAAFPDTTALNEEGFRRVALAEVRPEFWSHEFRFHAHASAPLLRTRLGLYGPEGMGAPLVGEFVMDTRLDGTYEAVKLDLGGEERTYADLLGSGGLLTADPAAARFPRMLWPPADGPGAEPFTAPGPARDVGSRDP